MPDRRQKQDLGVDNLAHIWHTSGMDDYTLVIAPPESERPVELSNGTRFYESVPVLAISAGRSPTVTLVLEVEAGRPVVSHLHIDRWVDPFEDGAPVGPEITAKFVHEVPVDRLIRDAISAVAQQASATVDNPARWAGPAALQTRRYRKTDDPANLKRVAEIVNTERASARANGWRPRPRAEVARQLPCSERTASRYIKEATARGLLTELEEAQ